MEVSYQAVKHYRPVPYAGRIDYLRARQTGDKLVMVRAQRQAWTFLARAGLVIHPLPGSHLKMMDEPEVIDTAVALTQVIGNLTFT